MSTMTIPPFPSQDLAKLVLGYLAEEQLMTAYDEFLQASPYLDALRNEYDRIFMTSLKNILAEYRAVKIYVETCKPFALRKKLFQCANLLEVVKFLINHIDINKIQTPDTSIHASSSDKSSLITLKPNCCEVCNSLKLPVCVCKAKHGEVHTTSMPLGNSNEQSARDSSIETTSLSDLPGNHVTARKKHVRVLEKETILSHSNSSCEQQDASSKQTTCIFQTASDCNSNSNAINVGVTSNLQNPNISAKTTDPSESRQKIEEFNDILKLVCNKNTQNISVQQGNVERRMSNAGTFQEFATGVIGGASKNIIVPDSSTSESTNTHMPATKESNLSVNTYCRKNKRAIKTQYLLKSTTTKDSLGPQPSEIIDIDAIQDVGYPKIKPKSDDSKIKIISDVKVDNETINTNLKMPSVLQNATSTPVMKMQTIVINGTPVYRPPQICSQSNFTKDEIMAMPTIIITPASGPPPLQPQITTSKRIPNIVPISQNVTAPSLGPLVIDVSSSTASLTVCGSTENEIGTQHSQETICNVSTLVKTVDTVPLVKSIDTVVKTTETISASLPKENVIAASVDTSTPQVLPPTRKSSSTPRRTSHVRVLDFTTPRRILHETINECVSNEIAEAEIVLSKSPNIVIPKVSTTIKNSVGNKQFGTEVNNATNNEKEKTSKVVTNKKNWDADLRALAVGSPLPRPKRKPKSTKKKKSEMQSENDKSDEKKLCKIKLKSKFNKDAEDPEKLCDDVNCGQTIVDIGIKPTINIISATDWNVPSLETDKNLNKSNNEEHDTPEVDRMSLEKAIGARLNISDLLETPYKQALYDIQMETPRFLGPDLPDDPMSDVKIMNIPTPRFLNTSKGTQATPSSYSSRPTDYSSGGSYYKPDDQDYMPLPEHLRCSETSSQEVLSVESPVKIDNDTTNKSENTRLKSRPVRQCTKNVSYYNSSNFNKTKERTDEVHEKSEDDSLCSDTISICSSSEKKTNKENISKTHKENISKTHKESKPNKENTPRPRAKTEKLKRTNLKKYKSPIKKEVSKSFMKIRPRRSPTKGKKKMSDSLHNKSKTINVKRTNSKERNIQPTPAISVVPTKSRRKSSTPRKLHCTKTFNSESSGHNSPDIVSKDKPDPPRVSLLCSHDSDIEQLPLRWSDDGSQDAKSKEVHDTGATDSEDITKIQEYIKTTVPIKTVANDREGSLHKDLVKRGFDIETAKIIERDLLDTPPYPKQDDSSNRERNKCDIRQEEGVLEKTIESESSVTDKLHIVQDESIEDLDDDEDDLEFSVSDCNEGSENFLTCHHDETNVKNTTELVKFKDTFSMEICIDDGAPIRLRATPLNMLFDEEPQTEDTIEYNQKEIEAAVKTITYVNTPMKDSIKAQCYEIFDSTLTSLDTPLKVNTHKEHGPEVTVTEIVLEVEKVDVKEKPDSKKRKRLQSGNNSDESVSDNKKVKSETQYLLNSANIQNIDIESVLSKLHGP